MNKISAIEAGQRQRARNWSLHIGSDYAGHRDLVISLVWGLIPDTDEGVIPFLRELEIRFDWPRIFIRSPVERWGDGRTDAIPATLWTGRQRAFAFRGMGIRFYRR